MNIDELLASERKRGGFSSAERAAMWSGIEQSVGVAAAGTIATTAASTALKSSAKLAKWKLGALLSAVAIGSAGAGAAAHARWGAPKIVHVEHAEHVVPATANVVPAAPPTVEPPTVALPTATPAPSAAPRANVAPRTAASSAPAAPAKDPALARERTLLDMARTALSRGDSTGALASLDTHAREFPSSQLAEEREVLAIQALASAGRMAEARQRSATFRTRWLNSPLRSIVDEATH